MDSQSTVFLLKKTENPDPAPSRLEQVHKISCMNANNRLSFQFGLFFVKQNEVHNTTPGITRDCQTIARQGMKTIRSLCLQQIALMLDHITF